MARHTRYDLPEVPCLAWVIMLIMAIEIDPLSEVPSYRQLAAVLRARIASGEIEDRKPLPSITYLVQETGLAVGTIRKAIGVLVDEGLAVTVPGRGTYARTPKA
jgi:GntR family transcriptional regulator